MDEVRLGAHRSRHPPSPALAGARIPLVVIYREGSEIRVERSEEKARNTAYLGTVFSVGLGVYVATLADRPLDWLIVAGFLTAGLLLCRETLRRRNVCIIRPDEIGHGDIGGKMYWFDRGPIARVTVADHLFVHVFAWDRNGESRESFVMAHFDAAELRQAFEEAGIPGR